MERTFITFAIALLCAGSVSAQVETIPDQKNAGSACILAADATVWTALGLSKEQLEKVHSIQTQCKTDCVTHQEGGEKDPEMSGAALKHYEDELKQLLSEEQYTKWQKWCNERPGRT